MQAHGLGAAGGGGHGCEHVAGGGGVAAAQRREDGEGEDRRRRSDGRGGEQAEGFDAPAAGRHARDRGSGGGLEPGFERFVEARPERWRLDACPKERGELRIALNVLAMGLVLMRGHRVTSSPDSSRRRARRMAARASERREATVPTGTSSASATVP